MRETVVERPISRALIAAAAVLASLVAVIYAVKVYQKTDYTDFLVYHRAAVRAAQGRWLEIYNFADGASPFRYAPVTLPFFRPFALLGIRAAQLAWFFLQYAWFALGFVFLYRGLRAFSPPRRAFGIAFLAALAILRFCLDAFTIGQTSSLLFLGFCGALYGWVANRPRLAGTALSVPAAFKIGPGFNFLLFGTAPFSRRTRAFVTPIKTLALLSVLTALWVGSWKVNLELWRGWIRIVSGDSLYYDASHYGSQSLKSALLRAVKVHWISVDLAMVAYAVTAAAVCLLIAAFWWLRSPRSAQGRFLFFSLGVFPYLWFMPETFKYSLTVLAIPIAALLASRKRDPFAWFALGFSFLVLSLAGLDIIGPTLFFGLQRASVPLIATVLLGAALFRQAWADSEPSAVSHEISAQIQSAQVVPWDRLPALEGELEATFLIPSPLDVPAPAALIARLASHARNTFGESFEILVIPYGAPDPFETQNTGAGNSAGPVNDPRIRQLAAIGEHGHGAALRRGFLECRGSRVFSYRTEQPCDWDFYRQSLALLNSGQDLVRANRRHPESRFRIPVRLLSVVYGRHRLGLIFNALVRELLPVSTTDTHSGTWAMSRAFAAEVFALQSSAGFLFELEISLVAQAQKMRAADLPVRIELPEEKSARRITGEAIAILLGLPRLAGRYRRGCYGSAPSPSGVTADDWGLSPAVNEGILELARQGVVRRVSLMANCPYLEHRLGELMAVPGVSLGLHFNLTYGAPFTKGLESVSPARFLLRWINPFGDKQTLKTLVSQELQAQLTRLNELGVRVEHFDGHHHIHVTPGLLGFLAPVLKKWQITRVRLPYDRGLIFSGKFPLLLLSRFARSQVDRNGFKSSPCFYPKFKNFGDQGELRSRIRDNYNHEVIVHPATRSDVATLEIPDSYSDERVVEFRSLSMLAYCRRETAP